MHEHIEDRRTLEAEAHNEAVGQAVSDYISDANTLCIDLTCQLDHSVDEVANRYAELSAILYQCEGIFADLFNGKTLEEIGTRRDLSPFRILESIRKESHELVEACVKDMLADKFGGGDE